MSRTIKFLLNAIVLGYLTFSILCWSYFDMDDNNIQTNFKSQKQNYSKRDYNLKKRPPHKPESGKNVIYVSTKSDIKGLKQKCEKLLCQNEEEIIIYCIGAAIQRGVVLALQLSESYVSYKLSTNTLTTELIDDLEPAADDADFEIQRRYNSGLRIRLFRTNPLEPAGEPATN